MRAFIIAILFFASMSTVDGQKRVNFNNGWEYLEENEPIIGKIESFKEWSAINLPHSWNAFDATDVKPGYRRDLGWYRKSVEITVEDGQSYLLYFEGANLVTNVYVNGRLAGGHVGGYVGFEVDITQYIASGANWIYISVDNSPDRTIIPSQKADFFIFGGLIRDVWFETRNKVHVKNILVHTPKVTKAYASTKISLSMSEKAEGVLDVSIHSQKGQTVSHTQKSFNGLKEITLSLPKFKDPQLWSPEHPNLYTLKVTYSDRLSGQKEVMEQQIGYRFYKFEDNGPFYLNGVRTKLKGTHLHEEYAGYGAAMPDSLRIKDLKMIKDMGANFVRLAHYPQDPSVYAACDSLGLIVWDELPWCRGGIGDSVWKENTMRLLERQIVQNYNHPSIFFWSLGNEVYWLPDYKDGDNRDSINVFLKKMNDRVHELDSGRLTAIRKYYEGSDIVDVFSPSIWAGWYGGAYQQYESALEDARYKYKRLVHAEYGGSSHLGRHIEKPYQIELSPDASVEEMINQASVKNVAKYGDWSENYMNDLFDWHLGISEKLDWFPGNLQWAFKDFGTPLRPENAIPYINQKGLVDRSGRPKDAYYVFKSHWATKPFAYIESHTWNERQGKLDEIHKIKVYSNAHSIELLHNGRKLTKKIRNKNSFPAQGLVWDMVFDEGPNVLKAVGYDKNGNNVTTDSITVNYSLQIAGDPESVAWQSETLPNGKLLITASMVDAQGNLCLQHNAKVYFDLMGDGELLTSYGIMGRSAVIETANGKASIEITPGNKDATLELRSQDFKGAFIKIPIE